MCVKKYLAFLVLVLVSAQLFALPAIFVGEDSRDAMIQNQEKRIEILEAQKIVLEAEIEQKQSEIESLEGSLQMCQGSLTANSNDAELIVTEANELQMQLNEALTELEALKASQSESEIELAKAEVLTETVTEIVEIEPNPFGVMLGGGAIYSMDGSLDAEVYAGLSYGMFGVYAGVQADVADPLDFTKYKYKAGVQLQF